jgi:hypothetical protein
MIRSMVLLLSIWNLFGLLPGDRVVLDELDCSYQDRRLVVRCHISGVDGDALRQALESGETITFEYLLELRRDRDIWFDEYVDEYNYSKILTFDTLTRQFLATTAQGGTRGEVTIMEDPILALRWLTGIERWEIPMSLAVRDQKNYVRAKVILRRRKLLLVIPLETATPWRRTAVTFP